jgi:membrane protease YdiL (CAAX protease family)
MSEQAAVGFWRTVRLLLGSARRRSVGRQRRQQALLNQRSGRKAINWGRLGPLIGLMVMVILHGLSALALLTAVKTGQRLDVERQGRMVVHASFLALVQEEDQAAGETDGAARQALDEGYEREARAIARRDGSQPAQVEAQLRQAVATGGSHALVTQEDAAPGLDGLGASGALARGLGGLILLWWLAMLVCQGEGLELDLQRRRHPMWEWLLSHPVKAGAVFMAEMLLPLSANPTYWAAPLFVGILYSTAQGAVTGLAAGLLIGVPVTVAAACLGKALEIMAMLRLAPRSRGAVIGILGWFGYASMVAMFVLPGMMEHLTPAGAPVIALAGRALWSLLGLFLGLDGQGGFSLLRGVLFGWAASGAVIALAVLASARSIRRGLSGAFADTAPPTGPRGRTRFGRQPLLRKEYLWFLRDRSAIVQAILIPVSIAGFQLFNLRHLLSQATHSWSYLGGAAVFFGTYFLWVLGPKSLTSEGSALWIALTWPQGLESILRAKARLWAMLASGLVLVVLLIDGYLFPQALWKIALVALGWCVFARSMAEKAVTLVTITAESGEVQNVPAGRRWAAQLGMLTFAIGVAMQQWNLAIVGIVYSWITAAAMWENLRARLPYLYDPWSEELPPPPTLMHAMVAVSTMVECASLVTALALALGGPDTLAVARGAGYGLCALGVSVGVSIFLSRRGVAPAAIWCWQGGAPAARSWLGRYVAADWRQAGWLLAGAGGGLGLAVLAHLYLMAAALIPGVAAMMQASARSMHAIPGMATSYAVIAILFAPFAEEYLFRGLMFKTLDRQWGGWRAVLGAAAFFAIYHPPLSWLPVGLVGAANCLLFKRSGRLAPAVVLHMVYNAVVTFWA